MAASLTTNLFLQGTFSLSVSVTNHVGLVLSLSKLPITVMIGQPIIFLINLVICFDFKVLDNSEKYPL